MKVLSRFLFLALPLTLLSIRSSMAETNTLNILPLGDSITQGGRSDRAEYTYRWPLFKMLVEAGVDFGFVGSMEGGLQPAAEWPAVHQGVPFDLNHEGVYGIKTADALERLPVAMQSWDQIPDVALIHLGTNDQQADDFEPAINRPLRGIIEGLRSKNPKMVIFLGHLNFDGTDEAREIRSVVEALATEMHRPKSPVVTVHHYRDFNEDPEHPQADTFDWAHPNPRGQEKMARRWFEAMRPYFDLKSL